MSHTTADVIEFAHQEWPAHLRQLAPIQAQTQRWLAPLNLSGDTEQAFVRAVDEAARNVVEHAYAPIPTGDAASDDVVELTFWTEDRTIYIEIVDHGRWRPPGATTSSRRSGFAIMSQLMPTVLVHHDLRGTRVLLRHTVPSR
jgi:serine/threonine-protein kinase RsbW